MSPTSNPLRFLAQHFSYINQSGNLHNIILRPAYRLHVLVFHICLYKFPYFANHSHYLGEFRFQNDALNESLDYGNLIKVP